MTEIEHVPGQIDVNARAASESALQLLNQALLYIDDARKRCIETSDVDGLMIGMANLAKFAEQLKVITDTLRTDVADMLPIGWHPVPHDLGWIERKRIEKSYVWDSDVVLRRVVRKAVDPAGTGEIMGNVVDVINRIQEAVLACAPLTASTSWRVTALREYDLDPDMYRETIEKPARATFHAEPPPNLRAKLVREHQKERAE